MPSTPTDFQIGDWITYLPEPEKEFEIIAVPGTPYADALPVSASVAPGFDFLLRRGGYFEGFEPYKSVRKSELRYPNFSNNSNAIDWILLRHKKPGDGQEVIIFEERGDKDKGYIRTATYRAATGIFTYDVIIGSKTTPYIATGVSRWAMS